MHASLRRILIPERHVVDELLDQHDAPPAEVERSLIDLRRINRFLLGRRAWRHLVRRAAGGTSPRSVLEIGTGTSDLLESVPQIPIRIGLDLKMDHLVFGRSIGDRTVHRVVGNAGALPFRSGSVDIVGSSHFFHHFSEDENEVILRESLRVAGRAVFVTDTRRHRLPLLFVKLLGVLRLVSRVTRHDAPASVSSGYTMREMEDFRRRFSDQHAVLRRQIPFRFGLTIRK
jgi:ubiquinone/menaquinone biosynthesis C-methylase UbiE